LLLPQPASLLRAASGLKVTAYSGCLFVIESNRQPPWWQLPLATPGFRAPDLTLRFAVGGAWRVSEFEEVGEHIVPIKKWSTFFN
jgi:hypothetical protein